VFENSKFTNRLYYEMATTKTFENVFNDADRLKIIRETFSVHIVLAFFATKERL